MAAYVRPAILELSGDLVVHSNYDHDWRPNHEAVVPSRWPYAVFSRTDVLASLLPGKIVWLVTRVSGSGGMPGLCARLVITAVEPHAPGRPGFDPRYAQYSFRASADPTETEYCHPFAADYIKDLPWWNAVMKAPKELRVFESLILQSIWDHESRRPVRDARFL